MTITRYVNGRYEQFELTKEELLDACKAHFAKQNEAYVRGFVEEDPDFEHLSEEEKEEVIKAIAYAMVSYIRVTGDDFDAYYECSKDYRKDPGADEAATE